MSKVSRRELARYASDELLKGKSAKAVASSLATLIVELRQAVEIEFLLDDIAAELEKRQELAVGRVSSARQLNEKVRGQLSAHLKKATGAKEVLLQEHQDKSLIGGLRVETASRVWDQSVARKLADLREAFNG